MKSSEMELAGLKKGLEQLKSIGIEVSITLLSPTYSIVGLYEWNKYGYF